MSYGKRLRKRRQNARRAEREAAELDRLRGDGAQCGNCRSFDPKPTLAAGARIPEGCDGLCHMESDFRGNVFVEGDSLCVHYHSQGSKP